MSSGNTVIKLEISFEVPKNCSCSPKLIRTNSPAKFNSPIRIKSAVYRKKRVTRNVIYNSPPMSEDGDHDDYLLNDASETESKSSKSVSTVRSRRLIPVRISSSKAACSFRETKLPILNHIPSFDNKITKLGVDTTESLDHEMRSMKDTDTSNKFMESLKQSNFRGFERIESIDDFPPQSPFSPLGSFSPLKRSDSSTMFNYNNSTENQQTPKSLSNYYQNSPKAFTFDNPMTRSYSTSRTSSFNSVPSFSSKEFSSGKEDYGMISRSRSISTGVTTLPSYQSLSSRSSSKSFKYQNRPPRPISTSSLSSSRFIPAVTPKNVSKLDMLLEMGFNFDKACYALQNHGDNFQDAVNELLSLSTAEDNTTFSANTYNI